MTERDIPKETDNPMVRVQQLLVQMERDLGRAIEIAHGSPLTRAEQQLLDPVVEHRLGECF